MTPTREQLLQAYAALPEGYQPAWGLDETRNAARHGSVDRFALVCEHVAAMPGTKPLRVLDIGCAQGYFALGLAAQLHERGVEVVGVDSLQDNVRFCERLAEYHGLKARFIHDRFDAGFFERHALGEFDAVLALNLLHHIRELDGTDAAENALAAIRAHSRVLFCELAQASEALEWVDAWHDSDHVLLGGYAFRRKLGEFATHLTQVRRPLYACSNSLACVQVRWFAFDRVQDRAHPGVPDRFAGQRRFFIGKKNIVKAYRGDGDFGKFNRAELKTEAEVLQALAGEPQRYPPLLAQANDGDTLWLARGMLPGTLVSELVESGADFDRADVIRALLEELAHLEKRGWHHADIRAWNMLWHGKTLRLIDFGSMTRTPHPLHRVALAAVLRELAQGRLSHRQPYYAAVHPVDDLSANLRPLLRYLYGCAQDRFSYGHARRLLDAAPDEDTPTVAVHADVLAACAREHCEAFARQTQHAETAERAAGDAETHARDLQRALERQTAEAQAERATAQQALSEAARHAESLEAELAESRRFVESLRKELDKVRKDAETERAASKAALTQASVHAQELQHALNRQTQDMAAERTACQASLTEAARHTESLEAELAESRRYVESLRTELEKVTAASQALRTELSRTHASAAQDHAAAQAALTEAARHTESLERERTQLNTEREQLHARLASVEQELERERTQLNTEREQLHARLASVEQELARMRGRFRALKAFWPRARGTRNKDE